MEKEEKLVHLGTSFKPHGIKGGFHFVLFNSEASILKVKSKIIIFPKNSKSSINSDGETHNIYNISFGNKVICYLENINDRNVVEQMLPFDIFVPRENFPHLKDDEVYLFDLIGMNVINESGESIGEVISHYDNGAQTILNIRLTNKTIEVPFVDAFVPHVCSKSNTLTLIMPEEIS